MGGYPVGGAPWAASEGHRGFTSADLPFPQRAVRRTGSRGTGRGRMEVAPCRGPGSDCVSSAATDASLVANFCDAVLGAWFNELRLAAGGPVRSGLRPRPRRPPIAVTACRVTPRRRAVDRVGAVRSARGKLPGGSGCGSFRHARSQEPQHSPIDRRRLPRSEAAEQSNRGKRHLPCENTHSDGTAKPPKAWNRRLSKTRTYGSLQAADVRLEENLRLSEPVAQTWFHAVQHGGIARRTWWHEVQRGLCNRLS
jgi:hypothetical protein